MYTRVHLERREVWEHSVVRRGRRLWDVGCVGSVGFLPEAFKGLSTSFYSKRGRVKQSQCRVCMRAL